MDGRNGYNEGERWIEIQPVICINDSIDLENK